MPDWKGKGQELKEKRKGKSKGRSKGRWVFFGILAALAVLLAVIGVYLYGKVNSGLFFEETRLNDYDVSGKTAKEVLLMMEKDYSAPKVAIKEKGETVLTLTLEELGYTIDQRKLLDNIQECMRSQNLSFLISLFEGNDYEVEVPFKFEETVFNQAVSSKNFSVARVASEDAVMEYDGRRYYIRPAVYGNEFDDADLQVIVRELTDKLTAASRPQTDIEVEVPEGLYFVPAVTQDDPGMNHTMNAYNSYCGAVITHTFGEETRTINWDTIRQWLVIGDTDYYIDEEAVYNYVIDLAASYDTLYYQRSFQTSVGTTVNYASSDYGYRIDQDGEFDQLMADIASNTAVTREPVYAVSGFSRNGRDDLNGNYVEVNLTSQHIWLYRDGNLVVESDMVSGLPKDGRETATGEFPIAFKASPYNLKGGGSSGSDSWDVTVQYWMPFYDGQGLHDASWRSAFGGAIYQSDGSHGCVNLPTNVAGTIYSNVDAGFPVLLYK